MIKGILWDNDGVLVDTERIFFEVNREILADEEVELSVDDFISWFLEESRGAWHLLHNRGYSFDQVAQLRQLRNLRYTVRLEQAAGLARTGIGEVLARLHGRTRMGVVTASFEHRFHLAHQKSDLLQYFDFIVTKQAHIRPKPFPDAYLLGLKLLGIAPQECIAVEDSPRGLAAASAAGIKCLVLRSELLSAYSFWGAYRVVDTAQELAKEIDRLLA
jgi:HAD superfamily hydrolase (TIGR01509 family)